MSLVTAKEKVPRFGLALSLSILGHFAGLLLWFELLHTSRMVLVAEVIVAASPVSHEAVVFNSEAAGAGLLRPHRRMKRLHKAVPVNPIIGTTSNSNSIGTLRQEAKRNTAGLMAQLKFRLTYGFGARDYELPIRKQGEVPSIPSSDLPPGFEQYLEIEVLIDTAGKVAEAKIVHGAVNQAIEERLLAAVRQFKYIPAKYQQTPVPCEVDIVVHVPS
jgi:TonB family protein